MRWTTVVTALIAIVLAVATVPVGASDHEPVDTALAKVQVVRYGGADRFETSVLTTKAFTDFKGDHIEDVTMVSGYKWHDAVVAAAIDSPVILTRRHAVPARTMEFLQRFPSPFVTLISTQTISPTVDRQLSDVGMDVFRIDGTDQFRTSVAVAEHSGFVDSPSRRTVIVASGQVFADALVAGQLANRENLPILLTPPNSLHSTVRQYLTSKDVEQVILMGGTAALSADVEASIKKLNIRVVRIAGETRFDTAVEVARFSGVWSCPTGGGSLAVGLSRAWVPFDAFSAAPMLARYGAPLLLTAPDELPAVTMAYLDEVRAAQAQCGDEPLMLLVIGGEAAVSQSAIDAYLQRGEEIVAD